MFNLLGDSYLFDRLGAAALLPRAGSRRGVCVGDQETAAKPEGMQHTLSVIGSSAGRKSRNPLVHFRPRRFGGVLGFFKF